MCLGIKNSLHVDFFEQKSSSQSNASKSINGKLDKRFYGMGDFDVVLIAGCLIQQIKLLVLQNFM